MKKTFGFVLAFVVAAIGSLQFAWAEAATPGSMAGDMITAISGYITENIGPLGIALAIVIGLGAAIVFVKRAFGRAS
jgi:hypothetical protein